MEKIPFDQLLLKTIETFQTIFLSRLKNYSGYLGDPLEYKLFIDRLKRGMHLDPSGVTSYLELKEHLPQILSGISFNGNDLIDNNAALHQFAVDYQKIAACLDAPEAIRVETEFFDELYRVVTKFRKNDFSKEELAELMRRSEFPAAFFDAQDQTAKLRVDQFSHGDFHSSSARIHDSIYAFWSIASLLHFLKEKQGDGVGLYAVIDRLSGENYFVFGVKNGENLTILSDHPTASGTFDHQAVNSFPERRIVTINQDSFLPASLLNIDLNWINGELYASRQGKELNEVLIRKNSLMRLGAISSLRKESYVWILAMIRMIDQRYFARQVPKQEPSYTGEQFLKEIGLKKIKAADDQERINHWMIEYYRKQGRLDSSLLFPVSDSGEYLSMVYDGERFFLRNRKDNPRNTKQGIQWKETENHEKGAASVWENAYIFIPTVFGTARELQMQIDHLQRANLASQLSCLLRYDYNAQIQTFRQRYVMRLKERMDWLLERVAKLHGETLPMTAILVDPKESYPGTFSVHWDDVLTSEDPFREQQTDYLIGNYQMIKYADRAEPVSVATCAVTGQKADLECQFIISSLNDLLYLTGWTLSDLPVPMQHCLFGNEFLIEPATDTEKDPIDNVVNPFDPQFQETRNQYHVAIPLSKAGYTKLRKQYGLKPDPFWLTSETTIM